MKIEYTTMSLRKRLLAITIAVTFFLFLITIRLFFVQVINGRELRSRALEQWMRDIPTSALRGTIYDRNGVVLASSFTTYDIYVRPSNISDFSQVANLLSSVLNMDVDKILEKISNKKMSEILIAKEVEKSLADKIIANYIQGIYLSQNSTRYYEYSDLLSQVLGYVSADGDGQSGIEAFFNKYLKGIDGIVATEADIKGRELKSGTTTYIPSIPGLSIHLSIDLQIQQIADTYAKQAQSSNGAKSATIIVMEPSTSQILAMAMTPSMDLNNLPRDNVQTLLALSQNTATASAYEPGSTFKILTCAIAMQEGLTSPSDGFYCAGSRIMNGVKVNCHRRGGHGSQTLAKGLSNSCNCVFMELATRIGLDKFYEYMGKFGIMDGMSLDFSAETAGILMSKNIVQNFDLARMGFGQAIAITPLQLINSVCGIINGGNLMKPQMVNKITTFDGDLAYTNNGSKLSQIVSKSVSDQINQMLEKVVDGGGGKNAYIDGLRVAGKTGTAQKYQNGAIAQGKYVASFIGYAPADNPKYAILVIVDEPGGSYYGSTVAAPYAKQVLKEIYEKCENMETAESLQVKNIQMPNILGQSLSEAAAKLSSLGLYFEYSGFDGTVVEQIPIAGTMLAEGDITTFTMSDYIGEL